MTAIRAEKWEKLFARMDSLEIKEEDLKEKFIMGAGKGGQKVNKTSSCVYLKHLPSGIEVKCQEARSREKNRYYARQRLCEQLEERLYKKQSQKQQEIEKKRRQKKRRSRRSQQKILSDKRHRSKVKKQRSEPRDES
ncbi:MAG: peptide chain release factor family protein [Chlamydiota bacterium]